MEILTVVLFGLGIVLLIGGAELLVRGGAGLAGAMGIPPLVVGLTVVALGTSSPELAVSVQASLDHQPDIAFGNVVGSNIANVLLILGLAALFAPLIVSHRLVRRDVPVMVAASVALVVLALDGTVTRGDGAILFAGIIAYTVYMIRTCRTDADADAMAERPAGADPSRNHILRHAATAAAGLALLVVGARWLVHGAVEIATMLGVSELVIGLTVIAVGTSLPEIATSILAVLRGQRDIAVGNVVGSNIYNILAILGLSAIVAPGGVPVAASALEFDVPVMVAVALLCLPIFVTGMRVSRGEGLLLLGYYIAYTLFLVLDATGHAVLPAFGTAAGWAVGATAAIVALAGFRAVRPRPAAAGTAAR